MHGIQKPAYGHAAYFAGLFACALFGAVTLADDAAASSGRFWMEPTAERPTPALGVAAPTYALWKDGAFSAPIHFDVQANYTAFIDRWELRIHRSGDTTFSKPIKVFSGYGASLLGGLNWDGKIKDGPALRPGERLLYVLRVEDLARNVDETKPREILVARYVMPQRQRELQREAQLYSATLSDGAPLQRREIPVIGSALAFRADGLKSGETVSFAGLRAAAGASGEVRVTQILPAGRYTIPVRSNALQRPALNFEISGDDAFYVPLSAEPLPGPVKPFAAVDGAPNVALARGDRPTLSAIGRLDGVSAVRVKVEKETPKARVALLGLDPRRSYALYEDDSGRRWLRAETAASAARFAAATPHAQHEAAATPPEPRLRPAATMRLALKDVGGLPEGFIAASAPAEDAPALAPARKGWGAASVILETAAPEVGPLAPPPPARPVQASLVGGVGATLANGVSALLSLLSGGFYFED